MLAHLAIRDLAIIEQTALDFDGGLNVLTGETGAGKSIVIGALSLVLGDRAKTEAVRKGARHAEVQALFRLPADGPTARRLDALDLLLDDDEADEVELVVRRIVSAGGKGRVYVNGVLQNVRTLASLTRGLVDISSQHQHTHLTDPRHHLGLLDTFGDLAGERATYDALWGELTEARGTVAALEARERERLQREDFVRYQLDEIKQLDPQAGEDEALTLERDRLAHAERLADGAREAVQGLTGRQAVCDLLVDAARTLERLREVDPTLGELCDRIEGARIDLDDIADEVRRYGDRIEIDPRRLRVVEDRLSALRRLERKHGATLAAVLATADALGAELLSFESLEGALREATDALAGAEARAHDAAAALSAARRQAADRLEALVNAELTSLRMAGAAVAFRLTRRDALGPDGLDAGEMTIRTNIDGDFMPLGRVASGGELSRLLLALKRALTRVDPVDTCVFDEVDAGVGGAVAEVIGLKLKEIARERQVIAITHLAQIAAHGDHHLKVVKHTAEHGVTTTAVEALEAIDRTEEIARMLGGVQITEQTRAHAEELLTLSAQRARAVKA